MPSGRPTDYTPEIALEICVRISEGESLRSICNSNDKFPAVSTVCLWNLEDRNGFSEQYMRARKAQAEILADELFDIADDGTNDWMTVKRGNLEVDVENHEVLNRSRLRVDTRKWYLSKVLPKIYGDKLVHAGDSDSPIGVQIVSSIPRPERK